jgi:pimeloyl-ACP methyl ester carboxylesterase
MWDHFEVIDCPMMLVRGSLSPVVDDDDVAEARRRQPDLVVEVVDGAGHSVQGDRPVELGDLLDGWLSGR